MNGRREKESRLLAFLETPGRYQIDLAQSASGVQIDADALAKADVIVVTASGGDAANAQAVIAAIRPRLRPRATVLLMLKGITPALLSQQFGEMVAAIEREGYAAIDVIHGADSLLLVSRYGPMLEPRDMTVWLDYADDEASLIYTDPGDLLRRMAMVSRRFYEIELLEHMAGLYRGGVLADAGANIGNHTVFLAKFASMTVQAFEPEPQAFACLETNVLANGLASRVKRRRVALGAAPGRGRMVSSQKDNLGATRFVTDAEADVPLTTLDLALADIAHIDAIKIDVEGMEAEVLRGGVAIIGRDKPDLFVECLDAARLEEITAWLAPFGYKRLGSHTANPTWEFSARR